MHYTSPNPSPPHIRISPPSHLRNLSPPQALNTSGYSDRMYGVEEGQRRFEELLQENLWLREQIERKRHGRVLDPHPMYMRNV